MRRALLVTMLAFCLAMLAAVLLVAYEARSSHFQARFFAAQAARLSVAVEAGESAAIVFPRDGPFDERMGYTRLPDTIEQLQRAGYGVERQARVSPQFLDAHAEGIFPIYRVKSRAGLEIIDARGESIYAFHAPQRHYERFEQIPTLVVDALLFIENRDLLNADEPTRNPAIEPMRLGRAVIDKGLEALGSPRGVPGGSTLATQMEKFRHSPAGRTDSVREKFRQMASASLRVYLDGEQTGDARRAIVRDYVNAVPLGARRGWGEVHGLGDGLAVWFGADFDAVNRRLNASPPEDSEQFGAYALAFRQMLSLVLAQQRPSSFLPDGIDALNERTAMFLRRLALEGIISEALRDAAIAQPLTLGEHVPDPEPAGALGAHEKLLRNLQGHLASTLGIAGVYRLDRLDMAAQTTLDLEVQGAVRDSLERLSDRAHLRRSGLGDRRHGGRGPADEIVYSVVILERGEDVNRVRVQVDTFEGNLDINEGSKLDLGSTAKLRTLVHYLEVIAALHAELGDLSGAELRALEIRRADRLTRWAATYLGRNPGAELAQMLEAAMNRSYSADPEQAFMTGGGQHYFQNSNSSHNERTFSVRRAFSASANLPFVRIMQDIVHFHVSRLPDNAAAMLDDPEDPRRAAYLTRFARADAQKFVRQFYDRYQGLDTEQTRRLLLRGTRVTPERRALIERALDAGAGELAGDLAGGADLNRRTGRHDLNPLELFVVRYLAEHPEATRQELFEESREAREQAEPWLLWPDRGREQDRRILFVLEEEAFERIHGAWAKLGYPFGHLVPSFATALGSSADRPIALAELVGIIQAGGIRRPTVRFEQFHLAEQTPYETHMSLQPPPGVQVLLPEVAAVARDALEEVVRRGTGRAVRRSFVDADGDRLTVAGKTGTGDNQYKLYNRAGDIVGSRTVNRTATWAFTLGDCYFGTIVAYVPGEEAARHTFMSALPVRVLDQLKDALEPLLADAQRCSE